MILEELLKNIEVKSIAGSADVDIKDVDIDSRKVAAGHLFVAIKGTQTDGHQYIQKAIELGASAILCEDMPDERQPQVCYVQVASTEAVVGQVATTFHGDPTSKLKLVGVTGTNGKSTITHLIATWLTALGRKTGILGTLGTGFYPNLIPCANTTLAAPWLCI